MLRPDHQVKEISLKVLAHVAVAALYGAAYLYGTSKRLANNK